MNTKSLDWKRRPCLKALLFKIGVLWHVGANYLGKTRVNGKNQSQWEKMGMGLNKACIAVGPGFSKAPRSGLSLLQSVTAQLSASLGIESSQGWILHFSFSWVGFPSTASSAWAVFCSPAVHGGFLVHVHHPSPPSSGNNKDKKTPTSTKPNSKAVLGEHLLTCWNQNIPQGGMRKLDSPGRFLPSSQGGEMPNSPFGSPTCVELMQGGTAPDLGTAKQFKLLFYYYYF